MIWARLKRFQQHNVDEIAHDPALRLYGVGLCLIHAVTFYFWAHLFFQHSFLNDDRGALGPLCWPFAPWCDQISLTPHMTAAIGAVYLALAAIGAYTFYTRKFDRGWWLLIALTVLKFAVVTIDYRTMGNYHYMPLAISLVFLFIPGRATACRLLLVAIYFGAGLLKFNNEWLSGSALTGDPGIYGITLEWLCAYVVVLETCFAFGFLSSHRTVRWLVFFQYVAFHLFSYLVVGYFYPVTALLLLAIFPLTWSFGSPFRPRRAHSVIIAIFALAQMIPLLQKGDPALTSRGRMYALNMLDATAICAVQYFVRFQGAQYEITPPQTRLAPRIACDPVVFWNYGRNLCRSNRHAAGFKDIDLVLSARRKTDQAFTQIVEAADFCSHARNYDTLWSNAWNEAL